MRNKKGDRNMRRDDAGQINNGGTRV